MYQNNRMELLVRIKGAVIGDWCLHELRGFSYDQFEIFEEKTQKFGSLMVSYRPDLDNAKK